jgi:hypothetical protein
MKPLLKTPSTANKNKTKQNKKPLVFLNETKS